MVEESLIEMLSANGKKLFSLCNYAVNAETKDRVLNRKFLGRLNLEAEWMEETLDKHGAIHNTSWLPFREIIAAERIFSSACLDLIHLKNTTPNYKLLKIDSNFNEDIDENLDSFFTIIVKTAEGVIKLGAKHNLDMSFAPLNYSLFKEEQIQGKLRSTRKSYRGENLHNKAIYLATTFLNLSPEVHIIEAVHCIKDRGIKDCIPDHINEEKLRILKARFHNLQSTYDTYLFKTDLEKGDKDLLTLRGHISIIYHLLCSATELSHYYERHILNIRHRFIKKNYMPVHKEKNMEMIIDFYIKYIDQYFSAAKDLCKSIIKQYAKIGEVKLPIPEYRGFHVRPSTLISKIVLHYGSEVKMKIGDEEYDASSPLELFRVNEKINSEKRKYINKLSEPLAPLNELSMKNLEEWPKKIQLVMLDLMDSKKIILYENNLSLEGITPEDEETPKEFFKRLLAIFLASGKIDIHSDIKVTFIGDKRVLEDLKILAENGYGEDKYGNNIMLPPELPYLRR